MYTDYNYSILIKKGGKNKIKVKSTHNNREFVFKFT